jgi:hypothetical protein
VRTELFDADATPLQIRGGKGYRIKLTLKPNVPAGALSEVVELKTNEAGSRGVLSLAVNGFIQAPLSVHPSDQVRFGPVVVGQKGEERKLQLVSAEPFKIKEVEGQGDYVFATILPVPASKVQVLTITFAPEKAGPVKKVLTVKTDTGKSVKLTVEGTGTDPK